MRNAATVLLTMIAIGYLAVCALVYASQDSLVFYPRPANQTARLEPWGQVFETPEARLHGWVIPASDPVEAPLVFYHGGNGEDVSAMALAMAGRGFPATLVVVPYRGYGDNKGMPSEAALFRDALAIHDQAVAAFPHDGRRIVIGRSLGSGVAVYLASERPIDAAILVTPFDSIANVAAESFPWLPVSLLLRHPFDSVGRAPGLDIPALFIVAEFDQVIPRASTEALLETWRGPVTRMLVAGAGHNDVSADPTYWTAVADFVTVGHDVPERPAD